MTKKQSLILWVIVGAIVLWLLWRNRKKVAPQVFNTPPPSYLNVAYPQMQLQTPTLQAQTLQAPTLQAPISGASCGCNPQASQYLSNVANSVNEAEKKIEDQLKAYTDSINQYFSTNTIQ